MNIPIIRRLLWVMNEILDSTPNGGITRQALSDKWEDSCKNDKPGNPIPERTFYRRQLLLYRRMRHLCGNFAIQHSNGPAAELVRRTLY